MKENKRVHSLPPTKPGIMRSAKKKIVNSTDYIKFQQIGLLESFKEAKITTKIFISIAAIVVLLIGTVSISGSLNSISEKEKELARLDSEIAEQTALNEELKREIQGDYKERLENEAREKLEMVYPDEIVFINRAG